MSEDEVEVSLAAKLTANSELIEKEDIKFVKEQLEEGISKADLVREAIRTYRQHQEGSLEAAEPEDGLSEEKSQELEEKMENKIESGGFL